MRSAENRQNTLSNIFYKSVLAVSLVLLGFSYAGKFPSTNTDALPYNIPPNRILDASVAAIALTAMAFSLRELNRSS